jgi:hypothetical protein
VPSFTTVRGFDFSSPKQFLQCLWKAQFGATPDPLMHRRYWRRDLDLANALHPVAFDFTAGAEGALAIERLLAGIAHGKDATGKLPNHFPRQWLHIFHEAFEGGLISPAVWGAAARMTYIASDAPIAAAGSANAAALEALRCTTPGTLMRASELALWLATSSVVTLYRGSCSASLDDAMSGLS